MGIGIVGEDQTDITPFQRQVFEAEKIRQNREKEKKRQEVQNGSMGGRRKNAAGGSSQSPTSSRSETIRYESEGTQSDDEDVLEVF